MNYILIMLLFFFFKKRYCILLEVSQQVSGVAGTRTWSLDSKFSALPTSLPTPQKSMET